MPLLRRALLLGTALLLAASAPAPPESVSAQSALSGRVLAAARGQVAWLDLQAPRPTPLTQLVRPAFAADIAGGAGLPFAVASVASPFAGRGALGGDLLLIDLPGAGSRTLLARESQTESLDLPAIWPDGSAILYQRSNLLVGVPMPGQAQHQYESRVEQIDPHGDHVLTVLHDARYPGPAPDGSQFVFVRSTDRGAGIFVHSMSDDADVPLVQPGQFLALAYPRFSPKGQQIAFAAISLLAPIGRSDGDGIWFGPRTAMAHGFPWEAWVINADGTGLRQFQDVVDDDPSIAWSPDGSQLLIYGGWGSYLVETQSGATASLSYLAGYGSVAWLPD